jgi:hypothetical protein
MGVLLSTDGNNFPLPRQRHFTHHHHHYHDATSSASTVIHPKNSDSDLYLESGSGAVDSYTTKSALQLTSNQSISLTQSEKAQHNTPIRRDSSSTMSALQLPTISGAPSTSGLSKNRRNSGNQGNRHVPSRAQPSKQAATPRRCRIFRRTQTQSKSSTAR